MRFLAIHFALFLGLMSGGCFSADDRGSITPIEPRDMIIYQESYIILVKKIEDGETVYEEFFFSDHKPVIDHFGDLRFLDSLTGDSMLVPEDFYFEVQQNQRAVKIN